MKSLLRRPGLVADLLALLHLLFVSFVVISELLIVVGYFAQWGFIDNLIFRVVHLGLVLYVFVQDILGKICPLTTWENRFRLLAGQSITGKPFIGRMVHKLLMCHLSEKTQRMMRISFAVVVMITFAVIRPKWSL